MPPDGETEQRRHPLYGANKATQRSQFMPRQIFTDKARRRLREPRLRRNRQHIQHGQAKRHNAEFCGPELSRCHDSEQEIERDAEIHTNDGDRRAARDKSSEDCQRC